MITVLEQRFMEVAIRQLPLISKRLEEIIELLKQKNNGTDIGERL